MKRIITLAALTVFAALTASAQYSVGTYQNTALNGGTNNVAATATNTYAIVIDVRKSSYVGFQLRTKYTGACTGTAKLNFARSADGVSYETTPGVTLTSAAGNGTTDVVTFGTQQVDGINYLKLVSIANTNSVPLTNIVLKYTVKR